MKLIDAILSENLGQVKKVLASGVDINQQAEEANTWSINKGDTPLMVASRSGYFDIALALVRAGANKDIQNEYNETALTLAIEDKDGEGFALALIDDGADINLQKNPGMTPLMTAFAEGSFHVASVLIDKGAIRHVQDWVLGDTALITSLGSSRNPTLTFPERIDIVIKLIKESPPKELALQNKDGVTALMAAAALGELRVVNALLDSGAELDLVDQNKNKASDYSKNSEIRGMLLTKSAEKAWNTYSNKNPAFNDMSETESFFYQAINQYKEISKENCSRECYAIAQNNLCDLYSQRAQLELDRGVSNRQYRLLGEAFYHAREYACIAKDNKQYLALYSKLSGQPLESTGPIVKIENVASALLYQCDKRRNQAAEITALKQEIIALKRQVEQASALDAGLDEHQAKRACSGPGFF